MYGYPVIASIQHYLSVGIYIPRQSVVDNHPPIVFVVKVLPDALELVGPGGRLTVISFHGLETRIVRKVRLHSLADVTKQ